MEAIPETYEELLKRAYQNMKVVKTGERFEYPVVIVSSQGNQTIIKNFVEISNILRRDVNHLVKYLAKELASSISISGKSAILVGKFKQELIQAKLNNYILEYVICKECKKPDTTLENFQGVMYKICQACGARSPVKSI
ncbi:MAG: translation initiation factor IF-2 subunit beta [archaeon]